MAKTRKLFTKRRLITRRRLKWAGTTLAAILSVVLALSGKGWAQVGRFSNDGTDCFLPSICQHITVLHGQLWFSSMTGQREDVGEMSMRWSLEESSVYGLRWGWTFEWWPGATSSYYSIKIPLWLPLLLIAAPTVWLWRTDRRAKPWQCANCRYDLRGLEPEPKADSSESYPTRCPECGCDSDAKEIV